VKAIQGNEQTPRQWDFNHGETNRDSIYEIGLGIKIACAYVTDFGVSKKRSNAFDWRVCEDAEARGHPSTKNGGRLFPFGEKVNDPN
jgi:hypothetical protein